MCTRTTQHFLNASLKLVFSPKLNRLQFITIIYEKKKRKKNKKKIEEKTRNLPTIKC